MLQKIVIRNYSCIRTLCLDFGFAEGKAPNGYQERPLMPFIETGGSKAGRVCPVMALYGANASGKTTILQAVRTVTEVVTNGWSPKSFHPYRMAAPSDDTKTSSFVLYFWKKKTLCRYEIAVTALGIACEALQCGDRTLYRVENGRLTAISDSLHSAGGSAEDVFKVRCLKAENGIQVKTLLHETVAALPGLSAELSAADEGVTRDLLFLDGPVPFTEGIEELAASYEGTEINGETAALNEIASYLHKLDVRVSGLKWGPREVPRAMADILYGLPPAVSLPGHSLLTVHKTAEGGEMLFDIAEESRGTQRLVGLLGKLLAAVRQGKTVLIDEIDDSLHSLLVIELVKLFKKRRLNRCGAQLIFTAHNTDLLAAKILGLSEVGIVSQSGFDGTEIMRLTQVPGLRNVDNFRRLYLNGEFGGVPSPYV